MSIRSHEGRVQMKRIPGRFFRNGVSGPSEPGGGVLQLIVAPDGGIIGATARTVQKSAPRSENAFACTDLGKMKFQIQFRNSGFQLERSGQLRHSRAAAQQFGFRTSEACFPVCRPDGKLDGTDPT